MCRSVLLPLLLILLCISTADALDDIQGVTAVWNDFVASLRRGDYRRAHALFSPQSRAVLAYGDFVAEYGPLSAAREMVLAKPDSQSTALDADWAELTYGGTHPGSGGKFRVGVAFTRNGGQWGLVAARNEPRERIEAGARAFLSRLWESRDLAAPQDLLAALEAAQGGNPVLQRYRLEWDGSRFQAFPREAGLRTFYVDAGGRVRSVEVYDEPPPLAEAIHEPEPEPAAPPELPEPAITNGGMPELNEPPLSTSSFDLEEELPEPPAPASAAPARPGLSLPDVIE